MTSDAFVDLLKIAQKHSVLEKLTAVVELGGESLRHQDWQDPNQRMDDIFARGFDRYGLGTHYRAWRAGGISADALITHLSKARQR